MATEPLLVWEGREYEHRPRSADWYWALGIITLAATIAAALFGAYLIALLAVIAGAVVAIHAYKTPPIHEFALHPHGLRIGEVFHPFSRMESFCVLEDPEEELPPILSLRNNSLIHPHLHVPLDGVDAEYVYAHLLEQLEEEYHEPTLVDVVSAWLGF